MRCGRPTWSTEEKWGFGAFGEYKNHEAVEQGRSRIAYFLEDSSSVFVVRQREFLVVLVGSSRCANKKYARTKTLHKSILQTGRNRKEEVGMCDGMYVYCVYA